MGRLETSRDNHISKYVLPAASRLLIEAACKGAPVRTLEEVAHIEMGQSPAGDSCNQDGEGVLLIGGPADLGLKYPNAKRWTNQPTKLCKEGEIIVCVRATIGEPRWADGVYCLGRGVASIRPLGSDLDSKFLFRIIEGNEDWLLSQGTGTTFKTISKAHIAQIKVPIISKDEQQQISSFLEWLEDKSENHPDFSAAPPLPSRLSEQRRIVAKIEALASKIEEARVQRSSASQLTESLIKSAIQKIVEHVKVTGNLGAVLKGKPRNGWSARCDNSEDGKPVLSLSAVTGFHYRQTEFKRTSLNTPPDAHFWLKEGDLLITRSNTPDLVGHVAIYNGTPSPCIYPDLMMRVDVDDSLADRRFVWYWLQSPVVREFIQKEAKGTSPTMKKISQGIVMQIPFPEALPLKEQRHIVAYLDALQTRVDALKKLQAQTAAELVALLPAILDRAFKGEL